MNLPPTTQSFVLHFGEMGSRWGINRTVGQIYALLYLSQRPLNADDICEALGFARSNVSMGLRELDSWQLIRLVHLPNDRRDHFTVPDDIWEIVRTLVEQRRKREIEPTLTMLRDILMESPASQEERQAQVRMREMHDLIETLTLWYQDMQKLEPDQLLNLLKLGSKAFKVYDMKNRLFDPKPGNSGKPGNPDDGT
ncbi:GbsR/MarR family transcriptional regulator [Orrella marina]|uniref:HTH-type transcriptional regulator n=1 Tax=Orrella marina TaxID=2163011 RepID=A0A2R4XNC5_9BURK|nr:GbsR/MarR family transcriptional regulator [Orrella marina]AWB35278.1 ArsR family transcriptional regulator [Orrella marina]